MSCISNRLKIQISITFHFTKKPIPYILIRLQKLVFFLSILVVFPVQMSKDF